MDLDDIKVTEIMTKKIYSVSPTDKIGSSDIFMVRNGIGSLLVVENDKLIGILTNGDIIRNRNTAGVIHKTVGDLMTKKPLIIPPDTSLKSAIKLMVTHSVEHIPVVDSSGKPIGLIGHTHIFRAILEKLK